MLAVSSYWRSGPVLNNAMSGIDMALWDIKGKLAGMPLYDLLGGRCRIAATVYVHASGRDPVEVEDEARRFMEQGFTPRPLPGRGSGSRPTASPARWTARSRTPPPASAAGVLGSRRLRAGRPRALRASAPHARRPRSSCCTISTSACRRSWLSAWLSELEPYRLFFLEDPFAPEDNGYFPLLRQQTSIPIAMGELYVNVNEYLPLIKDRLIDFIRVHLSDIGGITPARKLAAVVRVLRCAHRLARPGRRLAGRARGEPPSRPGRPQLRHPGGASLRRRLPGGFPRNARRSMTG